MASLRTFKKFVDKSQAEDLVLLLKEHQISANFIEVKPSLDAIYGNPETNIEYEIQILKEAFEKVNEILDQEANILVDQLESDHFLFEFTNEELYDLLLKPDEWSEIDQKLAYKILNDRGQNITEELLNSLKRQRYAELEKPEKSQSTWIVLGYISSLLGGILGIFIGWHMWKSTKTLPDGKLVYTFNENDRGHGKFMLIVGSIIFPIMVLLRVLLEM